MANLVNSNLDNGFDLFLAGEEIVGGYYSFEDVSLHSNDNSDNFLCPGTNFCHQTHAFPTDTLLPPNTVIGNYVEMDVDSTASTFSELSLQTNDNVGFIFKKDPHLGAIVRLPCSSPGDYTADNLHVEFEEEITTLSTSDFTEDDETDFLIYQDQDKSSQVKSKLHSAILNRCKAEGKDIIKILSDSESLKLEQKDMPSMIDKRKESERKERNKKSAKKSREAKKAEFIELKKKNDQLKHKNEEEKKSVEHLEKKLRMLEEIIYTYNLHPQKNEGSGYIDQFVDMDHQDMELSAYVLNTHPTDINLQINASDNDSFTLLPHNNVHIRELENKSPILEQFQNDISLNEDFFDSDELKEEDLKKIISALNESENVNQHTGSNEFVYQNVVNTTEVMYNGQEGLQQDRQQSSNYYQQQQQIPAYECKDQQIQAYECVAQQIQAYKSMNQIEQPDPQKVLSQLAELTQSNRHSDLQQSQKHFNQEMSTFVSDQKDESQNTCEQLFSSETPQFLNIYQLDSTTQNILQLSNNPNDMEVLATVPDYDSFNAAITKNVETEMPYNTDISLARKKGCDKSNLKSCNDTLNVWQVDAMCYDEDLQDLAQFFVSKPGVKKRKLNEDS